MNSYRDEMTDHLVNAFLRLQDPEEVYAFLEDACTIKEITEISRRYRVAKMLSEGSTFQEINKATGVSSATIGRVNTALRRGSGGYAAALKKEKAEE